MVRYLSLISFTQQGVAHIKNSPDRASKFSASVEAAGGRVVSKYWSIGEVDGTVVIEAPDDQTVSALLLKLAQEGNVRTRSMRVYDDEEFAAIVDNA
jgi:uncharacterized protein with GYD domain